MENETITLRKFESKDLNDFICLIKDKNNGEYAEYDDIYPNDDEGITKVFEYFVKSNDFYAVDLNGKVIGLIALNYINQDMRNLGFVIHSEYQRKGYGYEACRKALVLAKELGVKRIISGTAKVNIPALQLISKLGFHLVNKGSTSFVTNVVFESLEFGVDL